MLPKELLDRARLRSTCRGGGGAMEAGGEHGWILCLAQSSVVKPQSPLCRSAWIAWPTWFEFMIYI